MAQRLQANSNWPASQNNRTPMYNVPWNCFQREIGNVPRNKGTGGPPQELQWAAEDQLISKTHEELECELPVTARATYLIVFSHDGTLVASCHGDHNVYVTDLGSGKTVRKLSGHPRSPWCLAFHPSSNQILASGCIGGHVRVWDLHGGSELWTAQPDRGIYSLAFHPTDRVLVVATLNELHFWDWSQPVPFAKCITASEKEKVKYVSFDRLGHKLILGIGNRPSVQSQWDRMPVSMAPTNSSPTVSMSSASTNPPSPSYTPPLPTSTAPQQENRSASTSSTTTTTTTAPSSSNNSNSNNNNEQERRLSVSYQTLVQQYELLVRRYYDLSHVQASAARVVPRVGSPSTSGGPSFAPSNEEGIDPPEPEPSSAASSSSESRLPSSVESLATLHLELLRANLRRIRHPDFLSMPRVHRQRYLRATSDLISTEDGENNDGEETSEGQRQRSTAEGEGPHGSFSLQGSDSPSSSNATPSNDRPFASIRSAFRPRLTVPVAPEQAALDLRVRSSQSNSTTNNIDSTFSPSIRSAFQPRTASSQTNNSATRGNSSGRQGNRFSSPPADLSVRFGIQLLSRHIDNMQRLCRARLEILQLQQIRRMWEDLQRQIGSLHAAVRIGNSGATPSPSSGPSNYPNSPPSSPPPRPSRPPPPTSPPPPSSPPLPPPYAASPSSSDDNGDEPPGPSRVDDEEGSRVRELMELTRISGGEEIDSAGGSNEDGARSGEGDSAGVSSGVAGAPFRDRPGNQTSRKRARVPVRFPEPGPNRPVRLFARMSTATRPINRGRPPHYSPLLGRLASRPERRLLSLRVGRCGPPYVWLQRLPERVISASVAGRQRNDPERTDNQEETETPNNTSSGSNSINVIDVDDGEDAPIENLANEVEIVDVEDDSQDESPPAAPTPETNNNEPTNSDANEAAAPEPTSSQNSSQTNSARQAGEDFHGRFCSMISRLEVLVRQQRENREANWRARRDALWTRREAGRPEGGSQSSSDTNRNNTEFPVITLSDSSGEESDSNNSNASPLARRIRLIKQHHMQERRRAWRRVENEIRSSFAASLASAASASEPPQSSSPPPSTSSQLPPTPAGSNRRDEPSTSAGAPPSDEEWRWTRESTRLRARQVLSMMVESLTQFFEQHGLSQETPHAILDEQIYNLYVLLQLALELTDLLLMQLMSARRELEEQWWHTLRVPNSEGNNSSDTSRRSTNPYPTMADMITLDCHHGFYRNWSRFITRLGASHFNRRIWTNNNNSNNANESPQPPPPDTPDGTPDGPQQSSANSNSYGPPWRVTTNSNESPQPPSSDGTPDVPQQSSANSNTYRPPWRVTTNSNESPQSPPVDGASDPPQQPSGSSNTQRISSNPVYQIPLEDDLPEGSSSRTSEQPRPRQSFTIPEVQVNDVPVAPEVASLLDELSSGRPRARSPPPPSGIFIPVGSPRPGPMSGTSGSNVRRGRPNPFVQLHQLRRSAGSGAFLWGGVGGVGNGRGGAAEGRFRRFLHHRYVGPNPFDVEYREDLFQETTGNLFQVTPQGTFVQDPSSTTQTFRIQAWDFSSCTIPEIGDGKQNVVVPVCKIHNDSSVDVSCDGRLLVALVPPSRLQINTMLGIYSLEWGNLGECLFIMSLAQDAVSVSLSPTCRHLVVGLATHRMAHLPAERNTIAQVFRLERTPPYPSPPPSASSKGKGVGKGMRRGANNSTPNSSQVVGHLHHVREIEQRGRRSHFNLNTIRWMPGAGQGLVYGTSTGQLRVIR